MAKRLFTAIAGALAWLALSADCACAHCTSSEACLQAVEHAQRDVRTVAADFTQVKHVTLMDEPLVSSGRVLFKRPDRILLKIEQPEPLTVAITGRSVHIPNVPDHDQQALGMAQLAAMFAPLSAIFTGSEQILKESFDVTAREDDQSAIQVDLLPRDASAKRMFRNIQLRFTGPELVAQTIRLDDGLGDNLEITLRDVQRNVDLPDALFSVSTPAASATHGNQ